MSCNSLAGCVASREQRIIQMALCLLEKRVRKNARQFKTSEDTKSWLLLELSSLEREVFMVLYLDNQHRLIEKEVIALGGINSTEVHPREILKASLRHNAAAVILAHNHPSGWAEPSQADRHITDKLKDSLSQLDVKVLDHLVVGGAEVVSFAERGWL
ncbi:RadC family protein [Pectobacterium versatile]|uniref:RadC family protein n=1 Tax=Pectobacterium versatile TaxID=2488639 RepID=UPI00102F0662|nr:MULTISPECIES: DNA repair protein RadC [Pectobacterium]MBQ4781198.1 DNA repair protein RadC [Pectobacterium versatile]MBQ4785755.1 DNA repair protein RadC [Pectobacterium versatile]MCL6385222.1 DNA repair protein RadC [Pectobacterium carotovorum subsp. carotovorum]TAJ04977.1 DNA repair protein RadC [Pectobacterium versatile]